MILVELWKLIVVDSTITDDASPIGENGVNQI